MTKLQMMRYHFYVGLVTKDKDFYFNYPMARDMVIDTSPFKGMTIYEGIGVWKGDREPSMCIEVILSAEEIGQLDPHTKDKDHKDVIDIFAERLKELFNQESVLVTKEEVYTASY